MRRTGSVLVAAALLLAALPSFAQQQAGGFLTGVNPTRLNFQPIDTSRALRGATVAGGLRNPSLPGTSSFGRLFPRISLGSWPPRLPFTPILSGKNNPYQPNPIVGKNPLQTKKK